MANESGNPGGMRQGEQAEEHPVKCGCSEFPECTHVLYWYEGYRKAFAQAPDCADVQEAVVKKLGAVSKDALEAALRASTCDTKST